MQSSSTENSGDCCRTAPLSSATRRHVHFQDLAGSSTHVAANSHPIGPIPYIARAAIAHFAPMPTHRANILLALSRTLLVGKAVVLCIVNSFVERPKKSSRQCDDEPFPGPAAPVPGTPGDFLAVASEFPFHGYSIVRKRLHKRDPRQEACPMPLDASGTVRSQSPLLQQSCPLRVTPAVRNIVPRAL